MVEINNNLNLLLKAIGDDILNQYLNQTNWYTATDPWKFTPIYDIQGLVDHPIPFLGEQVRQVSDDTILAIGISNVPPKIAPAPHNDPVNSNITRLHFALQADDKSKLVVLNADGSIKSESIWIQGQLMEFADLNDTHYPINDSDTDRIVLLIDIWSNSKVINSNEIEKYYRYLNTLGWIK